MIALGLRFARMKYTRVDLNMSDAPRRSLTTGQDYDCTDLRSVRSRITSTEQCACIATASETLPSK